MFSDVILLHRQGSLPSPLQASDGLFWKTCLRQIAFFSSESFESIQDQLTNEDHVYQGTEAYRFLLQVICGLHSPLVGETEVYGQFKNAVAAFSLPVTPWGGQMRRFFQALFEDAKKIRGAHLVDLGSQSYGSVIRRELRDLKQIHVLGAGHLVQEILPWIAKDGSQVHVHCRDAQKAKHALRGFSGVRIHSLEVPADLSQAQSLVIAAPVTAEWISDWLEESGAARLEVIADTRGDSADDELNCDEGIRLLTLNDLLQRVSSNQVMIQSRKVSALAAIDELTSDRHKTVEYRPFGWEDVCA